MLWANINHEEGTPLILWVISALCRKWENNYGRQYCSLACMHLECGCVGI